MPDPRAGAFAPVCVVLAYIAKEIRSLMPPADISDVMRAIEQLLDELIATEGYVIHAQAAPDEDARIDLSQIDFEALRARFERGRKRTEAERLRSADRGQAQADGRAQPGAHGLPGEVPEDDRGVQRRQPERRAVLRGTAALRRRA